MEQDKLDGIRMEVDRIQREVHLRTVECSDTAPNSPQWQAESRESIKPSAEILHPEESQDGVTGQTPMIKGSLGKS